MYFADHQTYWYRGLGVLAAGGEAIGVIIPHTTFFQEVYGIIPSMNTLSLAYDGLTRMDVPVDGRNGILG